MYPPAARTHKGSAGTPPQKSGSLTRGLSGLISGSRVRRVGITPLLTPTLAPASPVCARPRARLGGRVFACTSHAPWQQGLTACNRAGNLFLRRTLPALCRVPPAARAATRRGHAPVRGRRFL